MYINYKSISDLNNAILKNINKFPHDVSLIVGVPRSGMLPANLLALYLNKPYTDIDSFIEGRVYGCGERGNFIQESNVNKVLIVDDSICSGNALKKVTEKVKNSTISSEISILYAAIFATSESKDKIDIYCEIIDGSRIFQWNLFHHKGFIPKSCFDIDGVLCLDPPVDDDGPIYTNYLLNAPSLYIPSLEIDTLVTCRLEKYRNVTETWLKNNGVRYKKLVMLDLPDKDSRIKWGKHALHKAEVYKRSNNVLFIESSKAQAEEIFRITGKPVFCIENFTMINNESWLFKKKEKTLKWFYSLKNRIFNRS